MAEKKVRDSQFAYNANSNLVLQAERDNRHHEATGEVESLWGKLSSSRMGDRVRTALPEEKKKKMHDKKRSRAERALKEEGRAKRVRGAGVFIDGKNMSVLTETQQLDTTSYRPKTKETQGAYEQLLSFVASKLGDQPAEILRNAADDVLTVLKNDTLRDPERLSEIQETLGRVDSAEFNKVVNMGKAISDFVNTIIEEEEGDDEEGKDMAEGVAVLFEEDEDAYDSASVAGSLGGGAADSDDEVGVEADHSVALAAATAAATGEGATLDADDDGLKLRDIDAYYLQRAVSKYYPDATEAQRLAAAILATLQITDEHECERELCDILTYDNFDFVRLLLKNRAKIAYLTRLRQAQTDDVKAAIRAEMEADVEGGGAAILAALDTTQTAKDWAQHRTGEFTSRVKREARALGGAGAVATPAAVQDVDDGVGAPADGATDAALADASLVDLESLAFKDGAHLMSNAGCDLPPGSTQMQKPGYVEVHIPPLAVEPMGAKERFIPVAELPPHTHKAFARRGVTRLNRVQSRLCEAALGRGENLLLCAPTGAGKTNVALLTMLHEIGKHVREGDGSVDTGAFKIVYVAPMKALVQEVVESFGACLKPYDITVRELSGDQSLTKAEIAATQVIVTTPEKWDIITRKSGDRTYTTLVRLIIIDEIHLLHDSRGPVLESLVARTLRYVEATKEDVRIVGLSATLPNYRDVADFLRVNPDSGLFQFDGSFRPCPLEQQYIGITERKALKRFQLMNTIAYDKTVLQVGASNPQQVIIFVHSRKETAKTAAALRDLALARDQTAVFVPDGAAAQSILEDASQATKNHDLADLLPYGFGVHHAGMSREDRTTVEDLFRNKMLPVLVSTATLAWGVNLPAHTVIIKGTQIYSPEKGRWTELGPLDVMQMLGRAGRPQYDKFGEGIIITSHSELQFYLSLLNEQLPIESQFVAKLADNLNAEVVLGTVSNVREAVRWLGYTYLFVRMMRNPGLYGVSDAAKAADPLLHQRRVDLVHSAATTLDKHGLIRYDRKSGNFQVTGLGRVASYYYVVHPSIATYNEFLKPTMSDIGLFRLFSLSDEFRHIVVRDEEKQELRKLIDRTPVPVKEGMDEPSAKVNVLLQAYISQLSLDGFALRSDMVYVQQSAGRLLRALFEICLRRGWASLADRTLALCKMVQRRMWLSQSPLRQLLPVKDPLNADRMLISHEIVRKIERKDIPWERYGDLTPQDLGELIGQARLGKRLHRCVHYFPKVELEARVLPITRDILQVELEVTPDFVFHPAVHGSMDAWWVVVEDVDGETVVHHEAFGLKARYAEEKAVVTFTVPITDPLPPQYFLRLVSDRWLHAETRLALPFRTLIRPAAAPEPAELLDLAPLPLAALKNKAYQGLYGGAFTKFNAIQTQTFHALYETDDNVLVAAPTGAGKTVCAELALFRLFAADAEATAVYVAPLPDIARARFADWSAKFGDGLGKTVVELTGEIAADLKLLAVAHVVITTPDKWDVISRRWRVRKPVQAVSLYVVDELHLVGGAAGPTLEVVTSRMRYMNAELEDTRPSKARIVALSAPVANAKDLAGWIEAPPAATFDFHPQVRPVPLEIRIQGFDINHFSSRLLAMARPVYSAAAAVSGAPGKPTVVFVPTRKQAQVTAIDLVAFAEADQRGAMFVHAKGDAGAALAAAGSDDVALEHVAGRGVAYYHEAQPEGVKAAVRALFASGVVSVLVVPAGMAWGLPLSCTQVVLMGTQSYDGREHRYVGYPIADVLQMMGLASRPGVDDGARCVILCATARKEYFKRFLYEALPVESHLDQFLADHLNAEITTREVESKQECVDWLTWTLFYRRLAKNPNYYNLQGVSAAHLSDHLSELVEATLADLETAHCVTVDDVDVSALNLGMIAAYYNIAYTTIEMFASSLSEKTRLKGMLAVLCDAAEYADLAVRHHDGKALQALAKHVKLPLPAGLTRYADVHVKANVLLQCHFARRVLPSDMALDRGEVVGKAIRLMQAMVDVISSNGWLKPALAVMELSQMTVQALWSDASPLLQLPHFTPELAHKCATASVPITDEDGETEEGPVESVFELMDLEPGVRSELLGFTASQMADVARFCNRYPNIDLSYEVQDAASITTSDSVTVVVALAREDTDGMDEGAGLGVVYAPLYPTQKTESWWMVVGNPATNACVAIKRLTLAKSAAVKLEFPAPETPGKHAYTLYFMCDSYMGCDQEYEFEVDVAQGEDMSDDDSE